MAGTEIVIVFSCSGLHQGTTRLKSSVCLSAPSLPCLCTLEVITDGSALSIDWMIPTPKPKPTTAATLSARASYKSTPACQLSGQSLSCPHEQSRLFSRLATLSPTPFATPSAATTPFRSAPLYTLAYPKPSLCLNTRANFPPPQCLASSLLLLQPKLYSTLGQLGLSGLNLNLTLLT